MRPCGANVVMKAPGGGRLRDYIFVFLRFLPIFSATDYDVNPSADLGIEDQLSAVPSSLETHSEAA
jgi:hypothetical protein